MDELKELSEFFNKYGDSGGQYIDKDYITYNGKLPTVFIKGVWSSKCGSNRYNQNGSYIGKKIEWKFIEEKNNNK